MQLWKKSVFSIIIFNVLIINSLILTGCVASMVRASFPTYQETTNAWSDVKENMGRVVFYYVKRTGSGTIRTPYSANFIIDNDKNLEAVLWDGMFLFADLPLGSHVVAPVAGCKKKKNIWKKVIK